MTTRRSRQRQRQQQRKQRRQKSNGTATKTDVDKNQRWKCGFRWKKKQKSQIDTQDRNTRCVYLYLCARERSEIVNYFEVNKSFMLCCGRKHIKLGQRRHSRRHRRWSLSIHSVGDVKSMPIIKINIVSFSIRDIFSHYIKVHFAVGKNEMLVSFCI